MCILRDPACLLESALHPHCCPLKRTSGANARALWVWSAIGLAVPLVPGILPWQPASCNIWRTSPSAELNCIAWSQNQQNVTIFWPYLTILHPSPASVAGGGAVLSVLSCGFLLSVLHHCCVHPNEWSQKSVGIFWFKEFSEYPVGIPNDAANKILIHKSRCHQAPHWLSKTGPHRPCVSSLHQLQRQLQRQLRHHLENGIPSGDLSYIGNINKQYIRA